MPDQGDHPAIVAEAALSAAVILQGRFSLGRKRPGSVKPIVAPADERLQ